MERNTWQKWIKWIESIIVFIQKKIYQETVCKIECWQFYKLESG